MDKGDLTLLSILSNSKIFFVSFPAKQLNFLVVLNDGKVSSIIFIDLPAGTGFSYSTVDQQGDWKTVHHAYQFLRKVLIIPCAV